MKAKEEKPKERIEEGRWANAKERENRMDREGPYVEERNGREEEAVQGWTEQGRDTSRRMQTHKPTTTAEGKKWRG